MKKSGRQRVPCGPGTTGEVPQGAGAENRRWLRSAIGFASLLLVIGGVVGLCSNTARGDEPSSGEAPPIGREEGEGAGSSSQSEIANAPYLLPASALGGSLSSSSEVEAQLTDEQRAEELPHRGLDREESLALINGVFKPELTGAAGTIDELHPERYLSDHVAVVPGYDLRHASGVVLGEPANPESSLLVDSTVPLRTEGLNGQLEPVDLELESHEGELQPATPLVEVNIPEYLGEGIALPEAEVGIEPVGAAESRAPSVIDQSVAVYPNVEPNVTLAVAPDPSGVETMTMLQDAEAPNSQTVRLSLPTDASLEATPQGGAQIVEGGQPVVVVLPPSAIDAAGASVPVDLQVSGDEITTIARPTDTTKYPVLVDPIYQEYGWRPYDTWAGLSDWVAATNTSSYVAENHVACSSPCPVGLEPGYPGLYLGGRAGAVSPGSQANWTLAVPRMSEELAVHKTPPTSFIASMVVQDFGFWASTDHNPSPDVVFGIWNWAKGEWTEGIGHGGNEGDLNNFATTYTFNAGQTIETKQAAVGLLSGDSHSMTAERQVYLGDALVAFGDYDIPTFGKISSPGWVKPGEAAPIGFEATDTGLGVSALHVTMESNKQNTWLTREGCTGVITSPCPRNWASTEGGRPPLEYDLSDMKEGINNLSITAEDPVGNVSKPVVAQIKVDGKAPELTSSGTLASGHSYEPAATPTVTVAALAKDGSTSAPQSGVASLELHVDKTLVGSATCSEQNCELAREWSIALGSLAVGSHTAILTATDRVGHETKKEIPFTIYHDTSPPAVKDPEELADAVSGPDGWLTEGTYKFTASAEDPQSGISSVTVAVDGTPVQAERSACEPKQEPLCVVQRTYTISTAAYGAGEHRITLTAVNGRGLTATKEWQIRVDPSSVISVGAATRTLQAVEETASTTEPGPANSGGTTVGPTEETSEGRAEPPALTVSGSEIRSVGTGVEATMSTDPAAPTTIVAPEGSVEFQPTTVANSATESHVVNEAAGVSADTAPETDSVVRPMFDGVTEFQAIRGPEAPETYSWEVDLSEGQTLKMAGENIAEVYYEDGTPAMAILPQPAHDATGRNVNTSITVSEGDVLTLTVHYREAGIVYPVVGGANFETGYESVEIFTPPPPEEHGGSGSEPDYVDGMSTGPINVSAPIYAPTNEPGEEADQGEATASSAHPPRLRRDWGVALCAPFNLCEIFENHVKGFFYFDYAEAWYPKNRNPVCEPSASINYSLSVEECEWVGPNHQKYGAGYHITARTMFTVTEDLFVTSKSSTKAVVFRAFGDGEIFAHETYEICNPSRPGCG